MNMIHISAAFAAGIGCGILATRSYFAKKYREIAEEEIKAMEAVMKKRTEDKETEPEEKPSKDKPEIFKSSIDEWEGRKKELVSYNNAVENYISSVPPTTNAIHSRLEDLEKKMAEEQHPTDESGEQYEITSMDWLDDPMYDKVILTYYVGDDTVANESGQIDDIDMSIGMEMFEIFKNNDEYEMYIRNPNLSIDYNIVKEPGCYHV